MNWTRFHDKYRTEESRPFTSRIVNAINEPEVEIVRYVCRAPLGDLIRDYQEHLKKPWWQRRGWEWEMVEKSMREKINMISIEWPYHG